MKKLFAVLLAMLMVLSLAACGAKEEETVVEEPEVVEEYDYAAKSEGVMTYAEYAAAPSDGSAEVVIEAYVQAAQSYWEGATIYLQDPDGAYFVYGGAISEDDYAKIVTSTDYTNWYGQGTGVKVKITGTKTEWSGEVEIADATVEIIDEEHTWLADATDVTAAFGTDALIDNANQLVKVSGTIAASTDSTGAEVAYLYNWDGSGEEGSDLYYNVEINGETYQFCVESYLCYAGSDAYEAVKALNVGDAVTITGFLYWYEGAQVHTTAVAK